jgi:2-oxoglutarate ferredoxin oxidoreductase subunit alpha
MKVNDISILIGGEAGEGITRAGTIFGKACMRGGLEVVGSNDYQSLIRGGHNFYTLRINNKPVFSQSDFVDLLVALNAETITLHGAEVVEGGGVICDLLDVKSNKKLNYFPVPLKKIVREDIGGPSIMRNTVALGAAFALLDFDLNLLKSVLVDTFNKKVAESNFKAAKKGFEYLNKNFKGQFNWVLKKKNISNKHKIFLNGNQAIGLGAIKAGCNFYAAYPMTPVTGLLHFLVANERKFGFLVFQPEGEIAAINMVTGAAFTGVRGMTSTSGGGFCLMSEGFGMGGMTETPLVIIMGQRGGPSTGLPTYTSQGDLRFVLHASHGEFPRVVIAPGDLEECFYETMRAFNWADKYQLPVILLADKFLVESEKAIEPFDLKKVKIERGNLITEPYLKKEEYKRYKLTETGVSLRAIPLTKGAIVRFNADEHNESGFTTEDPVVTKKMMDKRMKKIEHLVKELEERNEETTKFFGSNKARVTLLSWGSTKGPILDAISLLKKENIDVNFLQIIYLTPFPKKRIEKVLIKAKKSIIIENNKTSQLNSLIREHLLKKVDYNILKYDGRPFTPNYLVKRIKELL